MNVERLHAIILSIKSEIDSIGIVSHLAQLTAHLQNVVSQPQQPTHQTKVAAAREEINTGLTSAASNDYSPAWRQTVSELGIDDLLGLRLKERIDAIFLQNQITPQVALKKIREIEQSLNSCSEAINQMVAGFKSFGIEAEQLNPGEGEVGILVPRPYLDNRFDELAKELKELNGILTVMGEISTGEAEYFELKSISTTDPFFVLGATLGVLSTISVAVKPIISAYKEILEVRVLHAQLAEKKITSERLKGISDHAEEIMGNAIEQIKAELLERYPGEDGGRKNELANALGPALKKLANRIDRGFNIEVRVEPLDDIEQESKDVQEQIKTIQSAMSEMEFMKIEGGPILNLPENTDNIVD